MNAAADDASERTTARARGALAVVRILLFLEAAAVVAVVGWLVIDLFALRPSSYATAIALIVVAALGAVWTVANAVGAVRLAGWSRASAIVWQFLQLSVAIGAFQGLFARADIGWLLLIPAVVVVGLLLWPPVRLAYSNEERGTAAS
ncbi:hypothetical protein [Agromyces silvae]|uniref:hypothetical protein n=1 Tax=Agromyces silvae TaxID=3388266 RepID=UPI00280BFFE5|nr:hypothetical protein [Agromyces protaetiae]